MKDGLTPGYLVKKYNKDGVLVGFLFIYYDDYAHFCEIMKTEPELTNG
jgi:hypothetical protein